MAWALLRLTRSLLYLWSFSLCVTQPKYVISKYVRTLKIPVVCAWLNRIQNFLVLRSRYICQMFDNHCLLLTEPSPSFLSLSTVSLQNMVPLLDGPIEGGAQGISQQQLQEQEKRIEISCALAAEASRRSRLLSGEDSLHMASTKTITTSLTLPANCTLWSHITGQATVLTLSTTSCTFLHDSPNSHLKSNVDFCVLFKIQILPRSGKLKM